MTTKTTEKQNYKIPDEIFMETIKNSISIRMAFLSLGFKENGSSYRYFNDRVKELNLDTSHMLGMGHLKGKTHNWSDSIPLEEILIINSTYNNTTNLRKRLIKNGLLINQCSDCGMLPVWNGKPITLQIDHINGVRCDNRIENLRIICPNCHSQTETFAGKNIAKNKIPKPPKRIRRRKEDIPLKVPKPRPTKINWVSNDELLILLETHNYVQLGKILGVSDNSIRKRLNRKI